MAKALTSEFLKAIEPHALATGNAKEVFPLPGCTNQADQNGYIMGMCGEVLNMDLLIREAKANYPATWKSYVEQGKKWIGRRCSDCNGIAEWFLDYKLGGRHNTKAKYNFSQWCAGHNGKSLSNMPQIPATAVFCRNALGVIYHVGFLLRKYGPGPRQWLVVQAAGVKNGWVITRLPDSREWNCWGLMMAMFTYDVPAVVDKCPYAVPAILPQFGQKNDAARWLQWQLVHRGYDLGTYGPNTAGVDGDFGGATLKAINAVQKALKLPVSKAVTAELMRRLAA